MANKLAIGGFLVSKKRGGYMAKSRKEKRLARKQRAEEQTRSLQTSNEARFEKVYELGRQIIDKKWSDGQGLSRHQAKKEGDVYRYITSRKAYRDALANWRRVFPVRSAEERRRRFGRLRSDFKVCRPLYPKLCRQRFVGLDVDNVQGAFRQSL